MSTQCRQTSLHHREVMRSHLQLNFFTTTKKGEKAMCEEEWMAHGPSHNSPKKVAFRIARTTLKGNSWPSRRPRGPKPDMVVVDRGWVREDGKLAIDSLNFLIIGSNLKSSQTKFHQHIRRSLPLHGSCCRHATQSGTQGVLDGDWTCRQLHGRVAVR